MDGFKCECGMSGCGSVFESDKYWDEGDKTRTSEDQIILHRDCKYGKYFKIVYIGENFLLAEDV